MKISELIIHLEKILDDKGDLNVCISEPHEYWGSVEQYLTDYNVEVGHAQPKGPKSGEGEIAVVFNTL